MADNRITIQAEFGQNYKDLGFVGRVGENDSREIAFDCADVLTQFPGASIVCVIKRACDTKPYSAPLTEDGYNRILPLSAVENAVAGQIMIELRAVSNDTILKSAMFSGRISESLQGEGDRPGNPVRDVLDRVDSVLEEAKAARDKLDVLIDTIQGKLDNGDFVGAPGSDASVTAENIQAALGYAPAKVPETASWGIINNVNGEIAINPASNNTIASRITRQPITTGNFDYAVKAAMCDGKGATWTSAEQQAARDRMGLDKPWALIEEVEFSEAAMFQRTQEPDGTSYNFAELMLKVEFHPSSRTGNIPLHFVIGTLRKNITSYFVAPCDASATKYGCSKIWRENQHYRSGWWTCVRNVGEYAAYYENPLSTDKYPLSEGNITGVNIGVELDAGTKIKIYGVRA